MPSNVTAKTASAPSKLLSFVAITVAAAIVGVCTILGSGVQYVTMRASGHTFVLAVADTDTARQIGLGGRAGLAPAHGMLFVFQHAAKQCFWMKDMHFALDILWLDQDQRVIAVKRGISPATYPASFCVLNAKYVIELNAGAAARAHIHTGQTLTL